MNFNTIMKGAVGTMAGLAVFSLALRFGGNLPVVRQIKEGFKGNTAGSLFG